MITYLLFELIQSLGLIPLGPYPIQLPGHNELPTDITVTLPFLGTVAGTLSLDGDVIRLSVPEEIVVEDFVIPGIGSIDMAFTVSGALCPLAQEQVEAEITGTLIRVAPPIVSPCTANISMTGALQGSASPNQNIHNPYRRLRCSSAYYAWRARFSNPG